MILQDVVMDVKIKFKMQLCQNRTLSKQGL